MPQPMIIIAFTGPHGFASLMERNGSNVLEMGPLVLVYGLDLNLGAEHRIDFAVQPDSFLFEAQKSPVEDERILALLPDLLGRDVGNDVIRAESQRGSGWSWKEERERFGPPPRVLGPGGSRSIRHQTGRRKL